MPAFHKVPPFLSAPAHPYIVSKPSVAQTASNCLPMRHLSPTKLQSRWEHGLCYSCDGKIPSCSQMLGTSQLSLLFKESEAEVTLLDHFV